MNWHPKPIKTYHFSISHSSIWKMNWVGFSFFFYSNGFELFCSTIVFSLLGSLLRHTRSSITVSERDRKRLLKLLCDELNYRILYGHHDATFCRCPDKLCPLSFQLETLDSLTRLNKLDNIYQLWLDLIKNKKEGKDGASGSNGNKINKCELDVIQKPVQPSTLFSDGKVLLRKDIPTRKNDFTRERVENCIKEYKNCVSYHEKNKDDRKKYSCLLNPTACHLEADLQGVDQIKKKLCLLLKESSENGDALKIDIFSKFMSGGEELLNTFSCEKAKKPYDSMFYNNDDY